MADTYGMDDLSLIIENPEAFRSLIGDWPDLHDSEIVEMCMTRNPAPELTILLKVPVYERHDDRPYLAYHWNIHLAFVGVSGVDLGGFNEQNVIDGIYTTRAKDTTTHVEISSLYGVGGEFNCSSARVLDVQRTASVS